jgi:hypothetical protein
MGEGLKIADYYLLDGTKLVPLYLVAELKNGAKLLSEEETE